MIPKIIHYCWFGRNPLPPLAQECIASWKKFLPDYEIKEWNEENFDVNIIPYTAEAYKQKKYAFVSDYARFWIMYHYGGIYFDTDVEVIRPLDDIITRGNFMGFEVDPDGDNSPQNNDPKYAFSIALGLGFGMMPLHPFINKMMKLYETLSFEGNTDSPEFKTIVFYTTDLLLKEGLENRNGIQIVGDIIIYPHEYFAPINVITSRLQITENTRTIHRYMGSWTKSNVGLKQILKRFIPEIFIIWNNKRKRQLHRRFRNSKEEKL